MHENETWKVLLVGEWQALKNVRPHEPKIIIKESGRICNKDKINGYIEDLALTPTLKFLAAMWGVSKLIGSPRKGGHRNRVQRQLSLTSLQPTAKIKHENCQGINYIYKPKLTHKFDAIIVNLNLNLNLSQAFACKVTKVFGRC